MRPEARRHILPLGLLIAGLVCGGVCWMLEGTAFWVLVGVTLALLVAGIFAASRLEEARRAEHRRDRPSPRG